MCFQYFFIYVVFLQLCLYTVLSIVHSYYMYLCRSVVICLCVRSLFVSFFKVFRSLIIYCSLPVVDYVVRAFVISLVLSSFMTFSL